MSNVVVNPSRFAVAGVLDPLAIHGANLLFWWRSDLDITTSGIEVTSWVDQVGAIDATDVGGASARPDLISAAINGNDTLDFTTNSATRLQSSGAAGVDNIWTQGTETELWAVVKLTGAGDFGRMMAKGRPDSPTNIGWWYRINDEGASSRLRFEARCGSNRLDLTLNQLWSNGDFVVRSRWDGDGTTTPAAEVNGVIAAWIGSTVSGTYSDDSAQDWCIGNRPVSPSAEFPGEIAEIYAAINPTATTLTQDRAYLSDRYAIF